MFVPTRTTQVHIGTRSAWIVFSRIQFIWNIFVNQISVHFSVKHINIKCDTVALSLACYLYIKKTVVVGWDSIYEYAWQYFRREHYNMKERVMSVHSYKCIELLGENRGFNVQIQAIYVINREVDNWSENKFPFGFFVV